MTVNLEIKPTEPCTCKFCVKCCKHKPGWFVPDQCDALAKFFNMTIEQVFKKYLLADYFLFENREIFLLSPGILVYGENFTGVKFPDDPRGECVFLNKDDRCDIHAVKPKECLCSDHNHDVDGLYMHQEIAREWDSEEHQNFIKHLLKSAREREVVK